MGYRICPVCKSLINSLGYASHRAGHYRARQARLAQDLRAKVAGIVTPEALAEMDAQIDDNLRGRFNADLLAGYWKKRLAEAQR